MSNIFFYNHHFSFFRCFATAWVHPVGVWVKVSQCGEFTFETVQPYFWILDSVHDEGDNDWNHGDRNEDSDDELSPSWVIHFRCLLVVTRGKRCEVGLKIE